MRKVMLIAGLAKQIPVIEDMSYIGVDRGAFIALQQGIPLQCALGDFDSVNEEEYAQLCAYCEVRTLPAHKNETDSEEAIQHALSLGYDDIILYGGLGGRIDHELANLHLLIYRDLPITLMDEHNELRVIKTGSYHIKKTHKYLSFLALEESCISESGVQYPLDKQEVKPSDIYSISNEIQDETAFIQLHYGKMLMMQCDDKRHKN